ncbi:monovalent cation/H+ antiporter subunit D [Xylophilus sp.]|uniref:monovalent cation/H+ antiporter subunit D n=1 Tax=Xylophilus sp. TaxID=2653893 RepID=UPI0013BE7C69|nr:monovalent cation/H+ antiporter subunit D [Xylophilus sp.]KAF1046111.1 MAG: Na(+)/H(+) antiporter subunit D [Xylophilus sp.]
MGSLAAPLMPHLLLAPIVLPMLTAALMLLLKEERQRLKLTLNIGSTFLGLLAAVALLRWVDHQSEPATLGVYLPGNWPAPFGIVLALDRLSALMLVLAGTLGLASAVYAAARWHRAGVHFHPLFQLQLMGLAGAFLTADLFNLFVFFEILLAASYGLLLHGSGRPRVAAGLHYVAVNLAASSLFLIGASMLYGITGTLNMADLARAVPLVAPADRGLLHAAAAIPGVAFLIKAAQWPLNFWLVPAYAAATAPVGALFAIMTKVGVYVVLRLWTLLFGSEAGDSALFGAQWLVAGGLLTLGAAAVGTLSAQRLGHLAGYGAIVSAGTLVAAIGFGQNVLVAGALYYLVSATLAVGMLFLLADLIERWRNDGASVAPHARGDVAPFLAPDLRASDAAGIDDEPQDLIVGRPIPAAAAFLGIAFMACTLLLAGLPPLSGFVGKFAMLGAVLNPLGLGSSYGQQPGWAGWTLLALLIGSGLLSLLALSRAGIRHLWAPQGRDAPQLRLAEGLPVAALLLLCVLLTVKAGAVMRYTQATADALFAPEVYVRSVLGARPVPSPEASAAAAAAVEGAR